MRDKVLEEPPAGWLVPFLLLVLRDGDSYGHQLEETLDELGFDGMYPGEIYRTLWHMEQEGRGLCDHEEGKFRLPQRRYLITESGETHLEFWADSLTQCREEIGLFLRAYAGKPVWEAQRADEGLGFTGHAGLREV